MNAHKGSDSGFKLLSVQVNRSKHTAKNKAEQRSEPKHFTAMYKCIKKITLKNNIHIIYIYTQVKQEDKNVERVGIINVTDYFIYLR